MKVEVENFFQLRFKVEKDRSKLDGVKLNRISREDYQMLLVEFEEKEVKEEIWECGDSKSLGPDEYTFKFIKNFW